MTYKIFTETSSELIDAPTLQDALTIFGQTSDAEVIAVSNMDKFNEETETEIEKLKDLLRGLIDGYEQWEADIIANNSLWWPHAKDDAISGKLYNEMLILQEKRNDAKTILETK